MGGGFSSKNQASSNAGGSNAINRVQYIEHRRRSSIIDMDVEKLMGSQDGNGQGHVRNYRPTMMNGALQKGANAAANSQGSALAGGQDRPLRFSTGVEVFTRPMTLQKDKQTLHYTRQELFKMQQEAEEEDEAFSIVGVKVQDNTVVYGIRWLDENDGEVEWIKRQSVYEAGPTMLCEYESIHIEELMAMNATVADVLKAQIAEREKVEAQALMLKQEKEKKLAVAKEKAEAEAKALESAEAEANNESSPATETKEC